MSLELTKMFPLPGITIRPSRFYSLFFGLFPSLTGDVPHSRASCTHYATPIASPLPQIVLHRSRAYDPVELPQSHLLSSHPPISLPAPHCFPFSPLRPGATCPAARDLNRALALILCERTLQTQITFLNPLYLPYNKEYPTRLLES